MGNATSRNIRMTHNLCDGLYHTIHVRNTEEGSATFSQNIYMTSSSGTKTMQDIGASMAYRVLINAEVFAAYRRVQVDYESMGSQTLQSGPLFGMKLLF